MPHPPETNGDLSLHRPRAASRLELLIAPDDALRPGHAARRHLGLTLDDAYEMEFTCGGCRIMIRADCDLTPARTSRGTGGLEIREGNWPEPVGARLTTSTGDACNRWSIESDLYGLRPVYYGFDRRRRPVVSTRPELVAALIGAQISAESLAEHLLVGFNLDDHSPFERVHRLRPAERLLHDAHGGLGVETIACGDEPDAPGNADALGWIDQLRPTIVGTLKQGAALELSGGVDSRLVLAIGLSAGVRPRLAFTLGKETDEDVRLAALICRRFGIRHLILPVVIDRDRLARDALDFAMRSGFGVNACTHAWLPRAFRTLSAHRTIQMGGGGGECASGFYYSPLDFLCAVRPARRSWVKRRLFAGGIDLVDVLAHRAADELSARVAETALRVLSRARGSWRRRTDRFYLTQRVPNAGGPVLSASACWYRPVQPLLHRPYIEWSRSLATFSRTDRRRQMSLMHRLNPELAAIPFSHGRRYATGVAARMRIGAATLRSKGGKILRRLGARRAASDLGAAGVAEMLARDPSVQGALQELAGQSHLPVHAEGVSRLIAAPHARPHELGALLSAAWAAQAAAAITEDSAIASRSNGPAGSAEPPLELPRAA
jgi:asparagine synthase (glutamine-hydrolysing)